MSEFSENDETRQLILLSTEEDSDDGTWQTGAYQQFLRDDPPEDAVYDLLA